MKPSGQGPHWYPSVVSVQRTPGKQVSASHLGFGGCGEGVGKLPIPNPMTIKYSILNQVNLERTNENIPQ